MSATICKLLGSIKAAPTRDPAVGAAFMLPNLWLPCDHLGKLAIISKEKLYKEKRVT